MNSYIQSAGTKIKDLRARHYLKKQIHKKNDSKIINVGFMVQEPSIWDKQENVYLAMKADERFNPIMLVVPNYNFETKQLEENYPNFFFEKYPEAIKVFNGDGNIIDLEKYNLDYIFYPRPYDHYLPKQIGSEIVMKKVKCCYIPYGPEQYQTDQVMKLTYTASFTRNMYYIFTDHKKSIEFLKERYNRNYKKGYQHFEKILPPSFETYSKLADTKGETNVLWTPRWTTNIELGGSNFFRYKNEIINYKKSNPGVGIVFRPHPLMFSNFKKSEEMNEEEQREFIARLDEVNVRMDERVEIKKSFMEASVLLTDRSSIIELFFVTGKPIIYCTTEDEDEVPSNEMMKGIYIANSWADVEKYLQEIITGNDYLATERKKILDKEYKNINKVTDAIIEEIVSDFAK